MLGNKAKKQKIYQNLNLKLNIQPLFRNFY